MTTSNPQTPFMSPVSPTTREAPVRRDPHADLIRSHAELLAAEANARAAKRRVDLEELSSDLKTPEQRVRAWERVHALALPLDPNHPVLDVIAVRTRLTLQQIQAVQRDDAARRALRTAR